MSGGMGRVNVPSPVKLAVCLCPVNLAFGGLSLLIQTLDSNFILPHVEIINYFVNVYLLSGCWCC